MNTKPLFIFLLYFLFIILINSCGKIENLNLNASGHIDTSEVDVFSGPTFLIITRTDDFNLIKQDPIDNVITMINIDKSGNFLVDFTQFEIKSGDIIYLIAFIDNDYNYDIPLPTVGDYVGFYINSETLDTAYTVKNQNFINIKINRKIFDFESTIEGTINGVDSGDIILIAYSDEITTMNFSSINVDNIIGYKKIIKSDSPYTYNLSIMPYGKNIPIDNVYIYAFLDLNNNNLPDGGDKLGYHKNNTSYPEPITINNGIQTGIDIDFTMDLPTPSGYRINLQGSFSSPNGYDASSPPIFIIAAVTDNPQDLVNDPMSVIKNFQKITPGETTFNMELSNTDLIPGDKIMIIGLWDKDFESGFPEISTGDEVGFYFNTATFQFSVPLVKGINIASPGNNWTFDIDKTFYDFSATVQGTIQDNEAGDLVVIGYTGDMSSLDMSSINIRDIAGYNKISKPTGFYDYTLNIFPFGHNVPIDKVQIITFLDKNMNGVPDEGDRMGFYRNDSDHMPETISVLEGDNTGIDIEITKRIYNFTTSINFKFNPDNHPSDLAHGDNLISLVVHTDGINGNNIDIDYVLGMKNLSFMDNSNYVYNFELYNFIDENLGNLNSADSLSTNVITIFDRNDNGLPDSDEDIAAYWSRTFFFKFIYFPKTFPLILDTSNILSNPDNVRFINQKI